MEEQIYIVTLYKQEDLDQFYIDMEQKGIRISLKRPLSRNTHYWMTSEQAEELRQDPRVWGVTLLENFPDQSSSVVNNNPYTITGTFWKDDTIPSYNVSSTNLQWGQLHCAGTESQKDKLRFGTTNYGLNINITGNDYDITAASYTIDTTSYPVRGKLWVPTNLEDSVDVIVCYHGTLEDTGSETIATAATTMRSIMKDNVKIKDKIIFAVAYPQDNISVSRNINMLTQSELDNLYFGDNIVYARAALLWAKNNLNSALTSLGLSQQINKVFMFGHSQGGSLVHKLNTLETTDGVVVNAPGPIRLDETCSVATGNLTCNKLSALGSPTATPLSSNAYYQRSVANFVTGHKSKIIYLQALDDPTGGPGLDGQIVWMSELMTDMKNNNQEYEYITVPTGGHDSFVTNNVSQGIIRNTFQGFGPAYESKYDSVNIYNDGKHADVVIVDDPVSYDCEDWKSPSTGISRFVQYQWFNELNSYIIDNQLDDDGAVLPTGNIIYHTNANNPESHGNHVTGTASGKFYGWAKESNIYSLARGIGFASGQTVPSTLRFDYLRAFHKTKPINPETGRKNPTITNHSYGGLVNTGFITLEDIEYIFYRGTSYSSSNPPTGGWTQENVEKLFGVRFDIPNYPSYIIPIISDVMQAIEDGIIVIGSAGNSNLHIASGPSDPDWNNILKLNDNIFPAIYYNRGAWPNTPDSGSILVGALGKFRRFWKSEISNFGPGIDVFSPGQSILSVYNNTGYSDTKTGYSGNYYAVKSGTSMAAPQVCGVIALASNAITRFTQSDARNYLNKTSTSGEMTFNSGVLKDLSGFTDPGTFLDFTAEKGTPNLTLSVKNTRNTSGEISEVKGERKQNGQLYPRRSSLYG